MKIMVLKMLREKYGVSVRELSECCGLSLQRIYEIESSGRPVGEAVRRRIAEALERAIRRRYERVDALTASFMAHRDELFSYVEEADYEV